MSEVGDLLREGKVEEVRAELLRVLDRTRGHVGRSASLVGVSEPFFHWMLRRVGLSGEPTRVRARYKARYRVPRGIY